MRGRKVTVEDLRAYIGSKFGRLTVVDYIGRRGEGTRARHLFLCECTCGTRKEIRKEAIGGKRIKSCGCLNREQAKLVLRTHGLSYTAEYKTWHTMMDRCRSTSLNHASYYDRGITVCERWSKSPQAFIDDMGSCPGVGYSLDRIDNSKGYSPDNCRWATAKQQLNNTRRNRYLTYAGQTKTITEWAREIGMSPLTLGSRVRLMGWSAEKALTTPLHSKASA